MPYSRDGIVMELVVCFSISAPHGIEIRIGIEREDTGRGNNATMQQR